MCIKKLHYLSFFICHLFCSLSFYFVLQSLLSLLSLAYMMCLILCSEVREFTVDWNLRSAGCSIHWRKTYTAFHAGSPSLTAVLTMGWRGTFGVPQLSVIGPLSLWKTCFFTDFSNKSSGNLNIFIKSWCFMRWRDCFEECVFGNHGCILFLCWQIELIEGHCKSVTCKQRCRCCFCIRSVCMFKHNQTMIMCFST